MKGEAGVVVAHGQACWEAPSSSSSGMDVLDEEVAGLQMDIEWTEGMEQRVRELLDRSTLEASHFPDTRHGSLTGGSSTRHRSCSCRACPRAWRRQQGEFLGVR